MMNGSEIDERKVNQEKHMPMQEKHHLVEATGGLSALVS
jgi:hypothetical protein